MVEVEVEFLVRVSRVDSRCISACGLNIPAGFLFLPGARCARPTRVSPFKVGVCGSEKFRTAPVIDSFSKFYGIQYPPDIVRSVRLHNSKKPYTVDNTTTAPPVIWSRGFPCGGVIVAHREKLGSAPILKTASSQGEPSKYYQACVCKVHQETTCQYTRTGLSQQWRRKGRRKSRCYEPGRHINSFSQQCTCNNINLARDNIFW